MGDRAMAEIRTEGGSLFVYTHWAGCDLPDNAKGAILAAKPRWDDYPYATRIVVDQLIKGGRDGTAGFGLMLAPAAQDEYNDNKPSVVIDLLSQTLTIHSEGESKVSKFADIIKTETPA